MTTPDARAADLAALDERIARARGWTDYDQCGAPGRWGTDRSGKATFMADAEERPDGSWAPRFNCMLFQGFPRYSEDRALAMLLLEEEIDYLSDYTALDGVEMICRWREDAASVTEWIARQYAAMLDDGYEPGGGK